MTNTTVKQIADYILQEIKPLYPEQETKAITFRIVQHILNFSQSEIYLKSETNVPKSAVLEIEKIVVALKKFEPLQYILGETSFYGLTFMVNKNVLIPRPETEELVDWILKENGKAPLKAIDLGTGSGCIAASIACNRPNWGMLAADISQEALDLARQNALLNNAQVSFIMEDMLNFSARLLNQQFNLIISNPPYVTDDQKEEMLPNVLEYEPHIALFAPGLDPLVFYRKIAAFASTNLDTGGYVYLEINEAFPEETSEIFKKEGFETILKKDINGKYRMLKAFRND